MTASKIASLVLLTVLGHSAQASSNPQEYILPWENSHELLKYRSCGCADACWIAELTDRKSRRVKAALRCDCEALLVTYPANSAERTLATTCAAMNDRDDKMQAISDQMRSIVQGKLK